MKPTDPPGWGDSLRALARLRDDGILTAEEFDAKKAQILGLGTRASPAPRGGPGECRP